MSILKIQVTQDLEAFQTQFMDEFVTKLLDGRFCNTPNESALEGACQDIIYGLYSSTNYPFRYEVTADGHFFYIDSRTLDEDPYNINCFTMFQTKYEIILEE